MANQYISIRKSSFVRPRTSGPPGAFKTPKTPRKLEKTEKTRARRGHLARIGSKTPKSQKRGVFEPSSRKPRKQKTRKNAVFSSWALECTEMSVQKHAKTLCFRAGRSKTRKHAKTLCFRAGCSNRLPRSHWAFENIAQGDVFENTELENLAQGAVFECSGRSNRLLRSHWTLENIAQCCVLEKTKNTRAHRRREDSRK